MLGFSKGIDAYVSLPCFFSICAIVPLIISLDLRLKNKILLLYYSIPVFKILLQIFLLISSLLVLRNLISVKGLMLPNKSLSFITDNAKGKQPSKED